MSKITLPNPNLEFVPLDKLTASQQNQIVANINAVKDFADGLARGENFNANAVPQEALKRIEPVFKSLSREISLSFGKDDGLVSGKWYEVIFQPELSTGGRVYLTKYSILTGADELLVKYNQNAAGEWHSSMHISLPIKFNGKDINLMVKNEQGDQALNVNTRTMAYIREM